VLLSRYHGGGDLLYACAGAVVAGAVLAVLALGLARRARDQIQRTIGRSGGEGAARTGRALGLLGICLAVTGALALGFFGLLELFAS
jgi:uncharacterized metal-binding protein